MHRLPIVTRDPNSEEQLQRARQLSTKWNLPFAARAEQGLVLEVDDHKLALLQRDEPKLGAVFVDFASDALTFRRLHGGGRKEAIAKAIGIKGDYVPDVLDATAGLGRDAFVLAALGCRVDMIERSPVVAALLQDGLDRAGLNPDLQSWLSEKMQLFHGVSYDLLEQWQNRRPQVVYLDPMFPHRKKSALVKKEMRLFQQLLGPDEDADALLPPALKLATKRVVVKRPDAAPHLNNIRPSMTIASKKHRFDVYLTDL